MGLSNPKGSPIFRFPILPLLLVFKAPSPINRVSYSFYFTCWIWIENLLCTNCVRCLWGLFPFSIRSHLEWLKSSQVAAINTYLGGKPHSKLHDPFSIHHISFLFPSFSFISISTTLFCVLHLFPFGFSIVFYVLFFLHFNSAMHCFTAFFHIFQFQQWIIHVTLYWFLSLPLEVNLHTYVTTWLNSCPVGSSLGFTMIAKISILSQMSSKMEQSKINSHKKRYVIFVLIIETRKKSSTQVNLVVNFFIFLCLC